ncbi:MAG: amino acid permease, partial [Kutzneria sp.]|nr:amino acid permease [Kutzneria sp.]
SVPNGANTSSLDQSVFSLLVGGQSSIFGVFGMLAAASILFFAFIGFDVVATTAEETRNPQRDVPRGILGSLAIVTVLYIAVSFVVTGMESYTKLATGADGTKKTLATAFADNGVHWAAAVIAIGALAGLTTVVMVLLLGQTRILFAMSRDGLMPPVLAKTGARGTPVRATLTVVVAVAIAGGFFPSNKLEEVVNVGTLSAFVLVSAGVLVLRKTRPDLPRGFRAPLVPLVPILAIVSCLWLMINLTALTWVRFAVWMAIGIVFYFAYGARKSVLRASQSGGAGQGTEVAVDS